MKPLKADYGMLYNGLEIIFFERVGDDYERLFKTSAEDVSEENLKKIVGLLEKPDYDTTDINKVSNYFEQFDDENERLSLIEEASREHFFQNFQLSEDSEFGNLLINTIKLFEEQKGSSTFLDSAYDFWKQSYAKKPESVPAEWKPLMKEAGLSQGKEDLYRFMFCLETAYAVFARLILAKSGEDYGFPDVEFREFIENEVDNASHRGDIVQSSYAKITQELINNMQWRLVSSVFEEDIFYWWTEPYEDKTYKELFGHHATLEMGKFGESLAKMLLMIYKYDFSKIEGDPLGVLYQKYFDKETRKALGEFYTPQEVVDYILGSVEYEGRQVLDKRLLDPACGSGTFTVTALQKYLNASEQKAEEEGWDNVLDDICNKYRLVGFDIHPFATIMAQIQFMLVLLPYYKKAVNDAQDKGEHFTLQRVPIFRTDSLMDESEGEDSKMTLKDYEDGSIVSMDIKLPVTGAEEDSFFETEFEMPHTKTVRKQPQLDIHNNEEYFATLQALFDTVKQQADDMQKDGEKQEFNKTQFIRILKLHYLSDKNFDALADFFTPFANDLLEKIYRLQTEFDDGRLIKSIEDIFLAALLKNEQKYDYVVGNPPYVRIDHLPEGDKEDVKEEYGEYLSGKWDLYMPFLLRGGSWLKEDGKLGYICSNKFFLNESGEKTRKELLRYNWEEIVDLSGVEVFEGALPAPAIMIYSNKEIEETIDLDVKRTKELPQEILESDEEDLEKLESATEYLLQNLNFYKVPQSRYKNDEEFLFSIYPEEIADTVQKIENNSNRFEEKCLDGISEGDTKRKEEKNVLSEEEYLRLDKKEKENYRKVIRGSNVEKYYCSWEKSKRDYILDERPPENNRVLIKDMSSEMTTAPEYANYRCLRTIYCATLDEANSEIANEIVGQLNSSLSNFYYLAYFYTSQMSPRRGNYRFREQFIKRMPVITQENQDIHDKVEKIEKRKELRDKISTFPEEYDDGDTERVSEKFTLDVTKSGIDPHIQETQDGLYQVVIGKRKIRELLTVDTKDKARYAKSSLEGRRIPKNKQIEVLVPRSNAEVKRILEEFEDDKQKLEEMASVKELEEEINELVYQLYDLDENDIDVIEDFLEKF